MIKVHRFIGLLLAAIALAPLAVGAPAPARAAPGVAIYVDDFPLNNGSTKCSPNPLTVYSTIEQGIAAIGASRSNVTLYICPGTYTPSGRLLFQGFNTLKIIGKGSPIIVAPDTFENSLFRIEDSTKVLVQGLVIEGRGSLPEDRYSVALDIVYSTGTVTGNTIRNWHQETLYPATNKSTIAISDYAPGAAMNLTISNNTIFKSGDIGIAANEGGAPKISKNRVSFSAAPSPAWTYAGLNELQAGILLLMTGPGATVSGNDILSDETLLPEEFHDGTRGIELYSASMAKVTKNIIHGVSIGISIDTYCENAASPDAMSNTISGNTLYNVRHGLRIWGIGVSATCDNPQVGMNKITGNRFYTNLSDRHTTGVDLLLGGTATANDTVITNNTFAGFDEIFNPPTLPTGTYWPNTILPAPPAGAIK